MTRPESDEFHEHYARYIDEVADGDIVATLIAQMADTQGLLASVPAERETYRYAQGKWSVREVVGHLLDVERLFGLRALWIARDAVGEQPGMEQDDWAARSNAHGRTLADLAAEWSALRHANVLMFSSFDDAAWSRRGIASGHELTARAVPWIIAGHELHHRSLLKSRYLAAPEERA